MVNASLYESEPCMKDMAFKGSYSDELVRKLGY